MLRWDTTEWLECLDCRGCWVRQIPFTDPLDLYEEDYYGSPTRTAHDWWDFKEGSQNQFRWILAEARKRIPSGRWLDIGCGGGFFLELCRDAGYRVAGVELARQARDKARETLSIEIASKPVDQCGFEAGSFDIVSMNNVLEHLPNPHETLVEVYRLLRPGGLVTLSVPNANFGRLVLKTISPLSGALGLGNPIHSMAMFDARVHVYVFSPYALERLLRQAGFSNVEMFNEVPVLNWMSPWRNGMKLCQYWMAAMLRPMLGPKRLTGHGISTLARKP